jgi:hypothetical protein
MQFVAVLGLAVALIMSHDRLFEKVARTMRDREISKREAFWVWLGCVVGMVLIVAWCACCQWMGVW